MFFKRDVLKNFEIFIGKQLYRRLFLIHLQARPTVLLAPLVAASDFEWFLIQFNLFHAIGLLLCPLETDDFSGYKKRPVAWNVLTSVI